MNFNLKLHATQSLENPEIKTWKKKKITATAAFLYDYYLRNQ